MAEEKLSWMLQFDLAGQGLRDARSQIAALQQELGKGQKAMLEFEVQGKKVQVAVEGMGRSAGALSRLTGALGVVGAAVGSVVAGMVAGVRALDDFGDRAITAFGERQGTIRAYTTLLGDAKQAEIEFGKAQSLAAKTDLTSAQTEGAQKSLMVAGFRGKGLDQALLATLDVAAMAAPAERQMTMDRVSRALGQVFAKGRLQGEELMQLSEAGLSRTKVLESLRAMGVRGDVEKAISGGNVSSQMGIAAIERAVLAQFGTSKLGEFATGSAGSVTSLISNRDEAVQNLLKSFNADEMLPGMERYKAALKEQGEALSLTTSTGRNATTVLQDFANTSLSLKAAWTAFTTGFLESFTSSYTKTMAALGVNQKGMNNLGDSAKRLGEILGGVGTAVALLIRGFDYVAPVVSAIATGIQGLGAILATFGEMLADLAAGDFAEVKRDYERLRTRLGGGEEKQKKDNTTEKAMAEFGTAVAVDSLTGEVRGGAGTGGGAVAGVGLMRVDAPGASKAPGKNKQALRAIGGSGGSGGGSGGGGGGGGGGNSETYNTYEVKIEVHGGKDGAERIAEAVHTKFLRELGRYGRVPGGA